MKVYSWNVLFENKRFGAALDFIRHLDFDVLALQEVPERFLAELRALPYPLAASPDWDFVDTKGNRTTQYLVLLSRYPITGSETVPSPDEWYRAPSSLNRLLLSLIGWRKPYRNKTALIATVAPSDGKPFEVACLHLSVAFSYPALRYREFDSAMGRMTPGVPHIVCGDFNILEWPHLSIASWLSGGGFGDVAFWRREREAFERKFKKLGLQNPLRGKITHPIALSQLDHVLVPRGARVIAQKVIAATSGSDHHPVMVEIRI